MATSEPTEYAKLIKGNHLFRTGNLSHMEILAYIISNKTNKLLFFWIECDNLISLNPLNEHMHTAESKILKRYVTSLIFSFISSGTLKGIAMSTKNSYCHCILQTRLSTFDTEINF